MKLTYIFHSGFAIETCDCIIVIDFWMDPANVMTDLLRSNKPMYVLSSHFHEDHFTREILGWRSMKKNITYILSKDILRHRRAQKDEADVWLAKGGIWADKRLKLTACGSNDCGVSWIIESEGKRIFHAGDLNNWYARFLTDNYSGGTIYSEEFQEEIDPEKEEKLYLGELKDIAKHASSFDLVMFPIDGRIGNGYTRGGRQLIDRFEVGMFVPMHFVASGFQSAWRMKEFTDEKGIPFWSIKKEGEQFVLPSVIGRQPDL